MTNGLYAKVATVSKAIGSLQPDKRNQQQKYDYISADKILERAGSEMAAVGLVVVPALVDEKIESVEYQTGKWRYDCRVDFVMKLADSEGNTVEVVWFGRGSDYSVPDKAMYKAITSGHKYFLMKLFNVGVGNEDSEHEQPKATSNGATPTQKPTSGPLPDDETVIMETAAAEFFTTVTALVPRFSHEKHTKAAAKKLGVTAIPGKPDDRRLLYLRLKEYARARDAEEANEVLETTQQ